MSIEHKKLLSVLVNAFPNAEIDLQDTVGDQNHYAVAIKDAQFHGLSRIKSHKIVNASLKELLDSGELHAISVTTSSP